VESVQIIKDKNTKLPKGIAFVKMERESDGLRAIKGLDGTKVEGRTLRVSVANQRPEYKKDGFVSKSFELKDKKKSVKEQNQFKAKAKAKNAANSKVGLNVLFKYKKSKV
jgi:RNA recognition motif-containing protein